MSKPTHTGSFTFSGSFFNPTILRGLVELTNQTMGRDRYGHLIMVLTSAFGLVMVVGMSVNERKQGEEGEWEMAQTARNNVMEKYFDANRGVDLRRRKRDGSRRTWQVSQLWDNHKEIGRRIALGQKNTHIAQALGLTTTAVSLTRNSPVVQDYINTLSGARDSETVDVIKTIRDLAPEAIKLLGNIVKGNMSDATPTLQVKVATDILDRAGYASQKNVNVNTVHAIVSPADLAVIKRRALEIASFNQVVIDV